MMPRIVEIDIDEACTEFVMAVENRFYQERLMDTKYFQQALEEYALKCRAQIKLGDLTVGQRTTYFAAAMDDKTEKLLHALADKLGVTVEHLWAVLIRGNVIEGYVLLVFTLLGIALVLISALCIRHALRNDDDSSFAFAVSGFIGCGVGLAMFLSCLYWCAMDLANPEYGALMDVLSHLK